MEGKPWFHILKNITFLTQVGLSVAAPLVLCIWGAVWLQSRFGLGGWVVLVGFVLGLGGAVSGFMGFVRYVNREASRRDRDGKS
ncbi:MAG: AtpZ/AtpI family protein [Oscillospiraceae bacterium]|nr:AtpZ/AtpI family protein [Oscillospiraceae bacterium]